MHFYNVIKDLVVEKPIELFFDMDGVISSYDAGKPLDFLNKRPLKENIKKIDEVSKLPNVELNILSICKKDFQIEEKNIEVLNRTIMQMKIRRDSNRQKN